MKRILFIDRDGTLIREAPPTYQIDAFSKLEFYPFMFEYMGKIAREFDYELLMVTNQDGLGTAAFPEDQFWPVQNLVMKSMENEGIRFSAVHIDKSFPKDNAPTRKPGIGMLTAYLDNEEYDIENSYVIGDRITDVQLAKTTEWARIYEFMKLGMRRVIHERNTNETQIKIELNLDGSGKANIVTGLGFFDHMLEQIARHGKMNLTVRVNGDLHIDEHHTIEDTGIALGETFAKALADKRGMERYGFALPMDEAEAKVLIDFGGRAWIVWNAEFRREMIGEMPTEMFFHFFKSFSDAARCNLNIECRGENEHHKIEAIFKAFAKAIRMAVKRDPLSNYLPSTKGVL